MDTCYHCGEEILSNSNVLDDKSFCCSGCKTVYQLLKENDLSSFYTYEAGAGKRPRKEEQHRYAFLDIPEIRDKYIDFHSDKQSTIRLFIPSIHCSSCIYLLENIQKLHAGILSSQVHFVKREALISFDSSQISLSELATLLDKIGYSPNFGDRKQKEHSDSKKFLYKLGIAGFAFGSIMLWSFPEYLGMKDGFSEYRKLTTFLSFLVSIPVLVYSANEYLISAWKSIRYKSINLDVPISLGIVALYAQSCWIMASGGGPGYMDSFAAFIFFLLIGKWFQSKSYASLNYDRDYSSYFPVAVSKLNGDEEEIIEIDKLKIGDFFMLRNEEVLPCDAELVSDFMEVDYSFVTGEAEILRKEKGDFIYAGGKLVSGKAQFQVKKESNRSQLTQLWNLNDSNKDAGVLSDRFSVIFLLIVLVVSFIAGITWLFIEPGKSIEIVVSILIVACPCAIALSEPFTYGNIMRLLGRNGLYLKNALVIPNLNKCSDIVFDKTGTLTNTEGKVEYHGKELSLAQQTEIYSLSSASNHPNSKQISRYFRQNFPLKPFGISAFKEVKGAGIEAEVGGKLVRIGSPKFVNAAQNESGTHVSIDGDYLGFFHVESELRAGLETHFTELKKYKLHLLSGDGNKDARLINRLFPDSSCVHFQQNPLMKKEYVEQLEMENKHVLMVGDGLNDVGALKAATVGISVSEDIFQFTPSSDAIIESNSIYKLPLLLRISAFSKKILRVCILFSILYNLIGLSFAVLGNLSPLVAAILMPLSSVTVVIITVLGTLVFAPKK